MSEFRQTRIVGYTEATVLLSAEGARVSIVVCGLCGAAILRDPVDDVDRTKQHDDWHRGVVGARFIGG